MPRKKKDEGPIIGSGKDPENKLIVQKSRPLFALWQSDLSLAEFKILDMYLARIDTRKPEHRTVKLTKGELEKALGVSRISKDHLQQRLNNLYQPIDLAKEDKKRFHLVGLFEEAEAEQDDNGIWQITLTCTTSAMKYIFNVERLGYLRYKLRCITDLTSRYTYILFMYLEDNRFRKTWEVDVTTLRKILKCDTEPTYAQYKRFNDLILKKCHKELLTKTECRFTYEPIRTGRNVTSIRFTLETLNDSIAPGQMSLDDFADELDDDIDDPLGIYIEILPESLTREQVDALQSLAVKKVHYLPNGMWPRNALVADYLRQKVALMNAHNKDVKHPFSYLKTMIEQDEDVY